MRAALGASRARLGRMALVESLTLAACSAGAGIVVAYAGTSVILCVRPGSRPKVKAKRGYRGV